MADPKNPQTGLKITQKRSTIGCPPGQRRTIRALGLRRIGHTVVRPDNASVRGMVFTVRHLVELEEPDGAKRLPPEGDES